MLEVALHRIAAAGERILLALWGVGEPLVELDFAAIGQMRDAAGDSHAGQRDSAGAVIVAATPVGVGLDGRDLGCLGADLIGGGPRSDGQHECAAHPIRVLDRPLQCACTAHRAAEYRTDAADAQSVHQRDFGAHLVEDGDLREA